MAFITSTKWKSKSRYKMAYILFGWIAFFSVESFGQYEQGFLLQYYAGYNESDTTGGKTIFYSFFLYEKDTSLTPVKNVRIDTSSRHFTDYFVTEFVKLFSNKLNLIDNSPKKNEYKLRDCIPEHFYHVPNNFPKGLRINYIIDPDYAIIMLIQKVRFKKCLLNKRHWFDEMFHERIALRSEMEILELNEPERNKMKLLLCTIQNIKCIIK
jgi:hypothetical protein